MTRHIVLIKAETNVNWFCRLSSYLWSNLWLGHVMSSAPSGDDIHSLIIHWQNKYTDLHFSKLKSVTREPWVFLVQTSATLRSNPFHVTTQSSHYWSACIKEFLQPETACAVSLGIGLLEGVLWITKCYRRRRRRCRRICFLYSISYQLPQMCHWTIRISLAWNDFCWPSLFWVCPICWSWPTRQLIKT